MGPMPVVAAYNPTAVSHQMGPCHQGSCAPYTHQPVYHDGTTMHHAPPSLDYHHFNTNTYHPYSTPPGHCNPPATVLQAQSLVGQPDNNALYQGCPCCERAPYSPGRLSASNPMSQPSPRRLSSAASSSYGAAIPPVLPFRDPSCSSPSNLGFAHMNLNSSHYPETVNMMHSDASSFHINTDWASQSVSSSSSVVGPAGTNGVEETLDGAERQEPQRVLKMCGSATVSDDHAAHHVRCQQLAPKASLPSQIMGDAVSVEFVATTSLNGPGKIAIQPNPREERPHAPRLMCPYCAKAKDGFGGQPELDRHIATQHIPLKKWICIDPDTLEKNIPTKCYKCQYRKLYPREDNAASHLRRMHFNMRKHGVGNQHRGGKSGGSHPSLRELKLKGCLESVIIHDPKQLFDGPAPPPRQRNRNSRTTSGDSTSAQSPTDNVSSEYDSPVTLDSNNIDTNFNHPTHSDASGSVVGSEELFPNTSYEHGYGPEFMPRANLDMAPHQFVGSGMPGDASAAWPSSSSYDMQSDFPALNDYNTFLGSGADLSMDDFAFDINWATIMPDSATFSC